MNLRFTVFQVAARHIDYRFDDSHTPHFVVAEAQLADMNPDKSHNEYVVTDYKVKSLEDAKRWGRFDSGWRGHWLWSSRRKWCGVWLCQPGG